MQLNCPYCGLRDHQEFTYRGDASAVRPALKNTSVDDHNSYIFDRSNPDGVHRELWNHTSGCRTHVVVERNTVTHEVLSCKPVGPFARKLK